MNSDLMYIGNRIREEREKQGMSQEKLAELAGTTRKTISKIENADGAYSVEILIGICDGLSTSMTYIQPERFSKNKTATEAVFRFSQRLRRLSENKMKAALPAIDSLLAALEI